MSLAGKNLELFSFNIDVELCGLLVSLYQTGCNAVLTQWQETEQITFSAGYGIIYEISNNETQSQFPQLSGKITSFLVVVGLGSILCYKLLKLADWFHLVPFLKSSTIDSTNSPPSACGSVSSKHLSIKTCYFGPKSADSHLKNQHNSGEKNLPGCLPLKNLICNVVQGSTRGDVNSSSIQDVSSGDSDVSLYDSYKLKSRRNSKRQQRGWLVSKMQGYMLPRYSISKGKQEDANESSDSSQSPNVKREESVESVCSDFSLDFSVMIDQEPTGTLARMDQLFQEIQSLKSNCLSMDEDFGIIKTNRNLPGLGSLMEASKEVDNTEVKESAKACFKGLYSLTTINRSMSFDLSCGDSTDDESPLHKTYSSIPVQTEEESSSSLEWDSQETSPLESFDRLDNCTSLQSSMVSMGTLLPMEESWSPDSFDQLIDSVDDIEQTENLEWSETDSTLLMGCLDSTNVKSVIKSNNMYWDIIGPLIPLHDYIMSEKFANKLLPENTQKGFDAVCNIFRYSSIRLIRCDDNSAIRATLYQILSRGLPVPSGERTTYHLMEALNSGVDWLPHWNFPEQLPYNHNNFVEGMKSCLDALDNLVLCLEVVDNRTEKLIDVLKISPTLDLHLMEAVKFHMIGYALSTNGRNLQNNYHNVLVDVMNNYQPVGCIDFQKVEVEMEWLGCTLGVTLEVFKPTEYGTQNFQSHHPKSHNNWPTIVLLCGDSKDYSILVN